MARETGRRRHHGIRLQKFGYYQGKTLANETGISWYRLKDVNGYRCDIAPAEGTGIDAVALRTAFTDRDGDGLTRFVIYDYGPGDQVTVANSAVRVRATPLP